jgi:hypothetical protein
MPVPPQPIAEVPVEIELAPVTRALEGLLASIAGEQIAHVGADAAERIQPAMVVHDDASDGSVAGG